jgi:hypothetical protein
MQPQQQLQPPHYQVQLPTLGLTPPALSSGNLPKCHLQETLQPQQQQQQQQQQL